ncbi:ketohexokinase isoform X1 [Carcharodon carcharias]|uniref:ketohexokinase isoform X1 n=1 Tax=Carcharodon carcharias TaxID=13397 RepID=UPI001B7F6156|nr:ketohexokinase isoform X1 [Carcharodon carcharias]
MPPIHVQFCHYSVLPVDSWALWRLDVFQTSPEQVREEEAEGPPLTPEVTEGIHSPASHHLCQAGISADTSSSVGIRSSASVPGHGDEGTSNSLEVRAETGSAQGTGNWRTAGDQLHARSVGDDVPQEASVKQQMLEMQQVMWEDLAEIHETMHGMVPVLEESLQSIIDALSLIAECHASSMERVVTLVERLLQENSQGLLGLCRDLQALTVALTSAGHCPCERWFGHQVSQLSAHPSAVSREVQSDLMSVQQLSVISAGSSQGTSDEDSSSSTPLPVTVASEEAAANGERPAAELAAPSQAGPSNAPQARGGPPRSSRPAGQLSEQAVSDASASKRTAPRCSTRKRKFKSP